MIKPTVGRIVWLWNAWGTTLHKAQPFAATIAYVQSDEVINVAYVDHRGDPGSLCDVILLQDEAAPKSHEAYATWIGQAKANPPGAPAYTTVEARLDALERRADGARGKD